MSSSLYRVVALDRGLKVLSTFSAQHRELGASEVARHAGLPVATAYRLLRTLVESGYLEQRANGRFAPTVAVLSLGFAALQDSDIVEASRQLLHDLATKTGETTNLGVLVGSQVLYVARYKTSHLMVTNLHVGSTLPGTCTSIGKLLLALLPEADRERVLTSSDEERCHGPHALTGPKLLADLAAIRERGWGLQDEEIAHGLRSVSAPVRSSEGVLGAVNLVVEAARWNREQLIREFLPLVLDTAEQISMRLGYLAGVSSLEDTSEYWDQRSNTSTKK